jgi:hypothetical protein
MTTNTIDTTDTLAAEIATEIHGIDPQHMNLAEKLQALEVAVGHGQEAYVSTLITMLPLELREAASDGWDRTE